MAAACGAGKWGWMMEQNEAGTRMNWEESLKRVGLLQGDEL